MTNDAVLVLALPGAGAPLHNEVIEALLDKGWSMQGYDENVAGWVFYKSVSLQEILDEQISHTR